MFRLGIKVGLAAGATYYLAEQGVWKESSESTKLCDKIYTTAAPYVKQATKDLPIKIPDLPRSERTSFVMKQYWNQGVLATFAFIGDLPRHINNLANKGIDLVAQNEGIKQFLNSFSSAPVEVVKQAKIEASK